MVKLVEILQGLHFFFFMHTVDCLQMCINELYFVIFILFFSCILPASNLQPLTKKRV